MKIKEVINNEKKYLIGIKETNRNINIYLLKKWYIGYKKLFKYKVYRPLLPVYENIVSNVIYEYELKIRDNQALDKYMLR